MSVPCIYSLGALLNPTVNVKSIVFFKKNGVGVGLGGGGTGVCEVFFALLIE